MTFSFGSGKSAILRDFGVLRREFPEPMALSHRRDGRAWFGGRIPLPLNPNLGRISRCRPKAISRHTLAPMAEISTKRTPIRVAGSISLKYGGVDGAFLTHYRLRR